MIAGAVSAQTTDAPITVPSGQPVTFLETLQDRSAYGLTQHFRFVAPQIALGVSFEQSVADMEYLCNTYALPRLSNTGPQPSQIVISLSEQPTEFGVATPEIMQVFEAYVIEEGVCIWEAF